MVSDSPLVVWIGACGGLHSHKSAAQQTTTFSTLHAIDVTEINIQYFIIHRLRACTESHNEIWITNSLQVVHTITDHFTRVHISNNTELPNPKHTHKS